MDRYIVSRTKRSLFYLMMTFLIVGFIIAECILPSERSQSVSDKSITYEGSFTWEKSDGERETIEVPGRYDVKPGDTMVITPVLIISMQMSWQSEHRFRQSDSMWTAV